MALTAMESSCNRANSPEEQEYIKGRGARNPNLPDLNKRSTVVYLYNYFTHL